MCRRRLVRRYWGTHRETQFRCTHAISYTDLLWFGIGVEKYLEWANLAVASGLAAYGAQLITSIRKLIHSPPSTHIFTGAPPVGSRMLSTVTLNLRKR